MQLEAFSAGYSKGEDRLLLQVNCSDHIHRYWITRRAVLMLADAITKTLVKQYAFLGLASGSSNHLSELAAFGHASAIEKHPTTKSANQSEKIFGIPLLIYQVKYEAIDAETCSLKLMDADGRGFAYQLNRDLLHALLNLLQSQSIQANWAISLSMVFQHETNTLPESQHIH